MARSVVASGMAMDVQAMAGFYGSAQGAVVARILRARLALMWPEGTRHSVLGIGYAVPYLRLWRRSGPCVALASASLGALPWPAGAAGQICLGEADALPFPDLCFDRILLVHALECADNARRSLREAWRVLKDDGRMIVVVPNRRGLWARADSTPFGQGEPYSAGQLGRLLAASLFRIERRDTALYMPPSAARLVLRGAPAWERGGRRIAPGFAGVVIAEAAKDLHAAIPWQAGRRRRTVVMDMA